MRWLKVEIDVPYTSIVVTLGASEFIPQCGSGLGISGPRFFPPTAQDPLSPL
ncbi:MAG: hypothetical protein ACREXS_15025 [Gammaproteobacteria bacterium]